MIKHILSITSVACAMLCAHGAKEKAEEKVPQNAKVKAEEKPQKDGGYPLKKGYSHKKLESLFGIEFGWKKPDSWNDSGYQMYDVVPAYDFPPNKKFLDFNYYTVLFDDKGKSFYVRAMKQCSNLEEAYALKRKAIEVIELKYGVAMEEFGTLASGKTSLVSARAYFGDELFKQELNKSYARIRFANSREIIVCQAENKVIVYGNEPAMQTLAVIGYRLRQTADGVDAL